MGEKKKMPLAACTSLFKSLHVSACTAQHFGVIMASHPNKGLSQNQSSQVIQLNHQDKINKHKIRFQLQKHHKRTCYRKLPHAFLTSFTETFSLSFSAISMTASISFSRIPASSTDFSCVPLDIKPYSSTYYH